MNVVFILFIIIIIIIIFFFFLKFGWKLEIWKLL